MTDVGSRQVKPGRMAELFHQQREADPDASKDLLVTRMLAQLDIPQTPENVRDLRVVVTSLDTDVVQPMQALIVDDAPGLDWDEVVEQTFPASDAPPPPDE